MGGSENTPCWILATCVRFYKSTSKNKLAATPFSLPFSLKISIKTFKAKRLASPERGSLGSALTAAFHPLHLRGICEVFTWQQALWEYDGTHCYLNVFINLREMKILSESRKSSIQKLYLNLKNS